MHGKPKAKLQTINIGSLIVYLHYFRAGSNLAISLPGKQFCLFVAIHLWRKKIKIKKQTLTLKIELQHGQIAKSCTERVGRSAIGDPEALNMLPQQS